MTQPKQNLIQCLNQKLEGVKRGEQQAEVGPQAATTSFRASLKTSRRVWTGGVCRGKTGRKLFCHPQSSS